VTWYLPRATWADQPNPGGATVAGTCQSGTAVYDVTDSMTRLSGEMAQYSFVMSGSGETARFDGASGRLDVYLDIIGMRYTAPSTSACSYNRTTAPYSGSRLRRRTPASRA
jgi:hypothetical protein